MTHICKLKGVCSTSVAFTLDKDGIVNDIKFTGGCDGNLKGVALLSQGQEATKLISLLRGVHCGRKSTSCPDQFANALERTLQKIK